MIALLLFLIFNKYHSIWNETIVYIYCINDLRLVLTLNWNNYTQNFYDLISTLDRWSLFSFCVRLNVMRFIWYTSDGKHSIFDLETIWTTCMLKFINIVCRLILNKDFILDENHNCVPKWFFAKVKTRACRGFSNRCGAKNFRAHRKIS